MPSNPEPSRVYGYVSLVDPDTGANHLVLDYDYAPPETSIALQRRTFVFEGASNASQAFQVELSGGLERIGDPPKAYRYNVRMVQDRGQSGNPFSVLVGGAFELRYNPDVWHFVRVVPGSLYGRVKRVDAGGGVTYDYVTIPVTARSVPFDDPDMVPLA